MEEFVINEKTGYLVNFSSQEIANKIIMLMQNNKLRDEMGKFGRKWTEGKWTWGKSIGVLEEILINLVRH